MSSPVSPRMSVSFEESDNESSPYTLSISGRADEPPTDLTKSNNKQYILYPEDNTITALFDEWWNSTPYGIKLRELGRNPRWGLTSSKENSAWPHFIEGVDIIQGKPLAICKYCEKSQPHPSIKKSGTSALWKHLKSQTCQKKKKRPLSAQATLEVHWKRVC